MPIFLLNYQKIYLLLYTNTFSLSLYLLICKKITFPMHLKRMFGSEMLLLTYNCEGIISGNSFKYNNLFLFLHLFLIVLFSFFLFYFLEFIKAEGLHCNSRSNGNNGKWFLEDGLARESKLHSDAYQNIRLY